MVLWYKIGKIHYQKDHLAVRILFEAKEIRKDHF